MERSINWFEGTIADRTANAYEHAMMYEQGEPLESTRYARHRGHFSQATSHTASARGRRDPNARTPFNSNLAQLQGNISMTCEGLICAFVVNSPVSSCCLATPALAAHLVHFSLPSLIAKAHSHEYNRHSLSLITSKEKIDCTPGLGRTSQCLSASHTGFCPCSRHYVG